MKIYLRFNEIPEPDEKDGHLVKFDIGRSETPATGSKTIEWRRGLWTFEFLEDITARQLLELLIREARHERDG